MRHTNAPTPSPGSAVLAVASCGPIEGSTRTTEIDALDTACDARRAAPRDEYAFSKPFDPTAAEYIPNHSILRLTRSHLSRLSTTPDRMRVGGLAK
jgi:hypothetical protein